MFFLAVAIFGAVMVVTGLIMWFPLSFPSWLKKQHPKWLKEMEEEGTLVVSGTGAKEH
jgi:hypothetical protein